MSFSRSLLDSLLAAAHAAWPAIAIPDDEFVRYVAARIPASRPLDEALAAVRGADLYLACASARRDPAAHAAIEALLAELRPAVGAVVKDDDAIAEVEQILRERLLYADPPKIADYAGTGDLLAWLRVVAVRTALGLRREQAREVALAEAVAGAMPLAHASPDPQLEHFKRVYRTELQEAFRAALRGLDDRDRGLLKHRYVHGANVDELARIYAVHRATAARWVARAEERLMVQTRKAMMQRLRIDRAELDSVIRLVQSQLDASFHELLSQAD